MNRYQLATLVNWAGTLHTRKRLQKVVYLLQAAGCDLEAEFTLHHYGPYSHDIASLTDDMVQANLLDEKAHLNMAGKSFEYQLSERAIAQMEQMESDARHPTLLGAMSKHEPLARRLLEESNLPKLEYAATIAYFHKQKSGEDWQKAREGAAKFKKQPPDSQPMLDAERLAREVLGMGCRD